MNKCDWRNACDALNLVEVHAVPHRGLTATCRGGMQRHPPHLDPVRVHLNHAHAQVQLVRQAQHLVVRLQPVHLALRHVHAMPIDFCS